MSFYKETKSAPAFVATLRKFMKGPACLQWIGGWIGPLLLRLYLGVGLAAAVMAATPSDLPVNRLDQATDVWDALLARHVRPSGGVDYIGFAADLPQLKEFIQAYTKMSFKDASDDVKKAAYIHLYNAGMIYNVLRYAAAEHIAATSQQFTSFKIDSLKSGAGNLWNGDLTLQIGADHVTLDDIEHHLLRGVGASSKQTLLRVSQLDPRLHAAVNCAAYSCPRLRPSAYRANTIDSSLQKAMQDYLSDAQQFHKNSDDQLRANSIVFWYYDDFDEYGKKLRTGGAGDYLAQFIQDSAEDAVWKRAFLREHFNNRSKIALKLSSSFDFTYQWLINDVRNKP